MQLSNKTLEVLKNFSKINNSIVFRPGNVIYTIHSDRTLVARAVIDEEFEETVPISEGLSQFIRVLGLFEDKPDIKFEKNCMKVHSKAQSQIFKYSKEDLIVQPKRDPIENDEKIDYSFSFDITNNDLVKIKQAAYIQGLPNIVVRGQEGRVYLVACDVSGKKGSISDEYRLDVGVETDAEFQLVMMDSNLILLPRNYTVSVNTEHIIKWSGKPSSNKEGELAVDYWTPLEETSYYKG